MSGVRKTLGMGVVLVGAAVLVGLTADVVQADRYTSPSYTVDASVMNGFGGRGSSGSYQLVSSGGESIIGSGAGGSYKLGAGYVAQLSTSGAAATIQLTVQPSGLAAYYPLDENTGTTTADASSHHHAATLDAAAAWSASGKIGSAVDTSGGGAINAPDSTDLPSGNGLTVETWVNEASIAADKAIASHWNYSTSGSWAVQTGPSDNIRVFLASSATDPGNNYVDTAANSLGAAGAWHHVAVTYDGTQAQAGMVKVYIDGTAVGTTVSGTLPATLLDSSGTLSIGSFPGLGRYFNGALDEVKIFNRALTANEVTADYTAGASGVRAGIGLGKVVPGVSNTVNYDAIVTSPQTGYSLSVSQNHDLQSGAATVPAVSGTIASPVAWTEGTTKGLGFTLVSSTGGSLPAQWNSGASYAAFPTTSTSFYTRTGSTGTTGDVLTMRLRSDVSTAQAAGTYQNTVTYTATTTP